MFKTAGYIVEDPPLEVKGPGYSGLFGPFPTKPESKPSADFSFLPALVDPPTARKLIETPK